MTTVTKSSVRRKLMLIVVAATFAALLATAVAVGIYNLHAYQESWISDLETQSEVLAYSSAPALSFNDPAAAETILRMLQLRPSVLAAAIYDADGRVFATYARSGHESDAIAPVPAGAEPRIAGNRIVVSREIVANEEPIGTIRLLARYELFSRLKDYAGIVLMIMIGSLGLAVLISGWLQRAFTRPILAVADTARRVMTSRDFTLRARKSTDDEIGVLVDAFNEMLNEVGQRAQALEQSNRSLKREMTERRAAVEALRLADKRKDEFLATLAHELRNPLAPLVNSLHILKLAGENPELSSNARTVMERQLALMVRLIDDLLDVSRITTGKLVIKRERVDLRSVLESAREIADPVIKSRDHSITVDVPDEPLEVEADAVRLAQVFSNLLNNAAKFTEPGGEVHVTVAVENREVAVEITDNGQGIAPDSLDAVFEMFSQVDRTLERAQTGLGVGLALAQQLVALHGGTIDIQSDGVGLGTRVTVRLPLATRSNASPPSDSVTTRI